MVVSEGSVVQFEYLSCNITDLLSTGPVPCRSYCSLLFELFISSKKITLQLDVTVGLCTVLNRRRKNVTKIMLGESKTGTFETLGLFRI